MRMDGPANARLQCIVARANSILLAAEREDAIHQSVNRALMLARYLDARLDILLCDVDRGASAVESGAEQSQADARAFLDALRNSVVAPDVEITTDAAFDGSLHEHVACKARRECSSFIVKGFGRTPAVRESRLNWQLIRSSPAPLLLARGHAWHPRARFAALVDLREPPTAARSTEAAQVTTALQLACGAQLDVLFLHRDGDFDAVERAGQVADELHLSPERVHLLRGNAAESLAPFIIQREYDLVALAAAGEPAAAGIERSLAEHLIATTAFDLLFVKRTADSLAGVGAEQPSSAEFGRSWPKAFRWAGARAGARVTPRRGG